MKNHGLDLMIVTMESFITILDKAITEKMSTVELRDSQVSILEFMRELQLKDKQDDEASSQT